MYFVIVSFLSFFKVFFSLLMCEIFKEIVIYCFDIYFSQKFVKRTKIYLECLQKETKVWQLCYCGWVMQISLHTHSAPTEKLSSLTRTLGIRSGKISNKGAKMAILNLLHANISGIDTFLWFWNDAISMSLYVMQN